MKVLLVNGGPHKEGCTYTALTEVAKELNKEGIETEIFWIGLKPISGCIACGRWELSITLWGIFYIYSR